MKLKPDCMRAVLLQLEREATYTTNEYGTIEKNYVTIEELDGLITAYSKEDIFYSLDNLHQAGYIQMKTNWTTTGLYACWVSGLTFRGHEFLDKIRDDKAWTQIQNGMEAVRNYSLDAITAIANGVASAAISAYLAKNQFT